jgi:hypothetical protein
LSGSSLSGGELSGDTFASPSNSNKAHMMQTPSASHANNNEDSDSIHSGQLIFGSGGGLHSGSVGIAGGADVSNNSSGSGNESSVGRGGGLLLSMLNQGLSAPQLITDETSSAVVKNGGLLLPLDERTSSYIDSKCKFKCSFNYLFISS